MDDNVKPKLHIKCTLQKYAGDVPAEDIDSGRVQPFETLTSEHVVEMGGTKDAAD